MRLLIISCALLVGVYANRADACSNNFQCGMGEKCVKPAGSNAFSNDGECINTGGQQIQIQKRCDSNFDCNPGTRCTSQFGNGVCVER